jgi:hypothetical protein
MHQVKKLFGPIVLILHARDTELSSNSSSSISVDSGHHDHMLQLWRPFRGGLCSWGGWRWLGGRLRQGRNGGFVFSVASGAVVMRRRRRLVPVEDGGGV